MTLDSGPQAFERIFPGKSGALILGLGPDTDGLAALLTANNVKGPVFWIEHPDFPEQAENPDTSPGSLPTGWQRIRPHELEAVPSDAAVFFYRQNLLIFPEFWGRLLAAVTARRLGACPRARTRSALLPGDAHSLLTQELETALENDGHAVRRIAPAVMRNELQILLAEERPEFCLSVNLRGLDAEGRNFHLLRACGTKLAIWIVDNPLHILSGLHATWWHDAHIFVTDAGFLPILREAGARRIFHLPLGSWMRPPFQTQTGAGLAPLLFVGRSAFPGKNAFFAKTRVPQALLSRARDLLDTDETPDFHWWARQLRRETPGFNRAAGLGAEELSLARRALWLSAALPHGLTIFGDEAWRGLVPGLRDLRPPVDYYTTLPGLYSQARFSLNVTSLLLPAGLTQRHFDVWSAGGFLVSDDTPGLDIFPAELRRETCLRRSNELAPLLRRLENEPVLRGDLQEAWKSCLAQDHTYTHRVRQLRDRLFSGD